MAEPIIVHTNVGVGLKKGEYHDFDSHELPENTILMTSEPPSGYYKVYGLYLQKIGDKYHPVYVINSEKEE